MPGIGSVLGRGKRDFQISSVAGSSSAETKMTHRDEIFEFHPPPIPPNYHCQEPEIQEGLHGGGEGLHSQTPMEGECLDQSWMNSIRGKFWCEPRKIKAPFSWGPLFKIPPSVRHLDEKTYAPQIISIGPFQKRTSDLQAIAMEEHKWRYLRSILSILGRNGGDSLELCLVAVKITEKRVKECYSDEFEPDSNSFV